MHPLATSTYTNRHDTTGNIMVGVMSLRAHLDAVLTRIDDASSRVAEQASIGMRLAEISKADIMTQSEQTELVSKSMQEISLAIQEISLNVHSTANKAEYSRDLAHQGSDIAITTRKSIEDLQTSVKEIGHTVMLLANQTDEIIKAALVIEDISKKLTY